MAEPVIFPVVAMFNAKGERVVVNRNEMSVWLLRGYTTEAPKPKAPEPEPAKTAYLSLGPEGMKLETEADAVPQKPIMPQAMQTRRQRGR